VSYEIRRRAGEAVNLVCLEASDGPGGNIRTDRTDGYVLEWGPTGFLDNVPATPALVHRLGLDDEVQKADESAAIRWIWRAGRLRRVPSSPPAFLTSDILSWPAKLRVAMEPFARRRPDGDESVFDFAARRIGRESARVLVGAMVTGIYAGDARALSLRATFPKMWAMETEHGGLVRAMLARRKAARAAGTASAGPAGPGGVLTSFRGGLQTLIDRLAERVGPALRTGAPVDAVGDAGSRGFRVVLRHGAPLDADAVVLACPAWRAAEIVRAADPAMATAMDGIPSAPVAVVHLGFATSSLGETPTGFGFLVPRGEGLGMLGTLYSSNIFPGRAPAGTTLLTVMLGGAHEPDVVGRPDGDIVAAARAELQRAAGVGVAPRFVRIFRHPRGIPQYTLGHLDRVAEIERRLATHPGLHVCGNSYRGISLNLCVDEAPRIAEAVLAGLDAAGPRAGA